MVGGSPSPLTRRAVLLAAPALALSACGKAADAPQDPNVDTGTQKQGDVALLTGLLEAETTPGGAAADGREPAALARAIARSATAHQQTLAEAIRALGASPSAVTGPAADGPFDPAAALAAAQQGVRLYLDFIPKLSDGRVRELTASILADKAAHIAQLRMLLDQPPVPEAFVA